MIVNTDQGRYYINDRNVISIRNITASEKNMITLQDCKTLISVIGGSFYCKNSFEELVEISR